LTVRAHHALPPYLGGKRKLCPRIFREIDALVPRRHWAGLRFLDAFLGGGSVSLYAKSQGFRVTAYDIAMRSIVVGEALIANSRTRITREDIVAALAISERELIARAMPLVPAVFTQNVGRVLDQLLTAADRSLDCGKAALLRLLAIRVGMLAHPMSQIRPGTAHRATTGEWESITPSCVQHYISALRLDTPQKLWALAQKTNAGVFPGQGEVHQGSVLDALPAIHADIAYFDPPYSGVMSYEKEYRVIDQLLEGTTRETSPFTARDGAAMIDTLLERAQHIPIWVLSFGNATVSLEDLEAKMTRLGRRTKAIAIRYQHLPAVATAAKRELNREYLLIGVDPATTLPVRLESIREAVTV
jgi:adenine-specific DNA-methyltransferase